VANTRFRTTRRRMCGVFGIYGHPEAANSCYTASCRDRNDTRYLSFVCIERAGALFGRSMVWDLINSDIMDQFEISIEKFDEFAEEYAKRFMDISSYISSIDMFCDLIISNKPKILELGCGPGNISRYLKNRFWGSEYIAIDLAPKMIEIAKQQVKGIDFRVMDARDILSFETKFDAIMCSFCLPYLSKSDTQKLIADCSEKLLNNGVIYLSTMEGDESKAGFENTSFSGDSKVYINYHKQQDIEAALLSNGFIVKQINRQKYDELDGSVTIDLIFIATKK